MLTRDPVADRIDGVVVAACTRTVRGLRSELALGPDDGMPEPCVAGFDNLHTLRRSLYRRRITRLGPERLAQLCPVMEGALGCR